MMGSWIEILGLEDNLGMINQKDSLSTNLESNDGHQKDKGNNDDEELAVWSVMLFVTVTIPLFMFAQL